MSSINLFSISIFLAFGLTACQPSAPPEPEKKPPDMKALFGEEYQPGDIGHAFGDVVFVSADGAQITINHGPIHGTPTPPATSQFEVIYAEDLSGISVSDPVEFLVRKGEDGTYRINAICKMKQEGTGCLDDLKGR